MTRGRLFRGPQHKGLTAYFYFDPYHEDISFCLATHSNSLNESSNKNNHSKNAVLTLSLSLWVSLALSPSLSDTQIESRQAWQRPELSN